MASPWGTGSCSKATATSSALAATYGVGAGVGVAAEFVDVLPQAANPMAAATAPPTSCIELPNPNPRLEAIPCHIGLSTSLAIALFEP